MTAKRQGTVSLDPIFWEWLDEQIATFRFNNRSHGIEFALNKLIKEETGKDESPSGT